MTRYFAFLRAINVGGHNVKMEALLKHFEEIGFANVSTFIASGNVIFDADAPDVNTLERRIETKLNDALGYSVATFVRSSAEMERIASYEPFPAKDLEADGNSLYVVFLADAPGAEVCDKVLALRSDLDDFHVHDREIYWLCRDKISDSPVFIRGLLDKATRVPATSRNMNTIKRLVGKYGGKRS
jgi:uncharacterized protein (DUF1697 family)